MKRTLEELASPKYIATLSGPPLGRTDSALQYLRCLYLQLSPKTVEKSADRLLLNDIFAISICSFVEKNDHKTRFSAWTNRLELHEIIRNPKSLPEVNKFAESPLGHCRAKEAEIS